MLSYRHAFHAGNHADVLKHCVLTLVLEYITEKDKPFLYVDTHAGAGVYDLHGDWANKTRDYDTGIGRIWASNRASCPPAMQAYMKIIETLNAGGALREYPGSPWVALQLLRPQDKARLFELHSKEYRLVEALFANNKQFKTEQGDGFRGLTAVLPPAERRAVVLVDPPYEVKADYQTVVDSIKTAYKKFSTGVYLIWYPVVNRKFSNKIERELMESGIRNILLAELAIRVDAEEAGMTASGMIIINPPWQLQDALKNIMPYLQQILAPDEGSYRLLQLVPE